MLQEFKEFALRGNVIDLAIAVIIGRSGGEIISSLVSDIIMPPIGLFLGNADFRDLFVNLSEGRYETLAAAEEAGAITINYGVFINTIVDFLIIALVLFLIVRQVNRLQKEAEEEKPEEPTTKECPYCLSTIPLGATRCPHCTAELE